MLLTFVTVVHLIVAFILIFFVLLQDPKGGGAMGVFGGAGGGSNSLFGATGAGNFLTTVTKGAAIVFAFTCVMLTYLISHPGKSVLDNANIPAATSSAPAAAAPEAASAPAANAPAPTENAPQTPPPAQGQ